MSRKVLWTAEAEVALSDLLAYLGTGWGRTAASAFYDDVERTVALLKVFPEAGVIEVLDKGIRSIPLARQVHLFYLMSGGNVIILELIDVRSGRMQQIRE